MNMLKDTINQVTIDRSERKDKKRIKKGFRVIWKLLKSRMSSPFKAIQAEAKRILLMQ